MPVVKITCVMCQTDHFIQMTQEQFDELNSPNRRHIQNIFPEMNPSVREIFISQVCPTCFDKMFDEMEMEDE